MVKYPKIDDINFYNKINKIFKKFKIKNNKLTSDQICYPSKFKLQLPQKFVSEFINPSTPYKGLLLFHQIGAGKTCAAISIAENFKKKKNILIVTPASLMGNFFKELRSSCTGDEYISPSDRKKLENYKPNESKCKEIIKKVNKRINKYYTVLSYNKFVQKLKNKKIKLKNTLLIIDEVQNIVSESGIFYNIIYNNIKKSPDDFRIILLSGTPMFDKPVEIGLTLNLLKLKNEFPIGSKFNKIFLKTSKKDKNEIVYKIKNLNKFKMLSKGLISYYRGAPPISFPKKNISIVKCRMSDYQYKSYKTVATEEGPFRTGDILKLPNNFFIGSRIISNIAFPKKEINKDGYNLLEKEKLLMRNLKEYSIKFYKIYQNLRKSEGPVFIFSNFKDIGGIKSLVKFLEFHGYKSYKDYGEGEKRYAVWTGDEPHVVKEEIKFIFNQKENENGSKIKIMLGSPSIKEGVTLLRVEQVHMLEPYWNFSRMKQIIGRAIRYCSHKDLPKRRRFVDVFLYISTYPNIKTIDEYIWKLAKKKQKLIKQFEDSLKEKAIDCEIFYEGNNYEDEEPIKCEI